MADRKISDLTALTTPASGDYLPIVDISEAAAASKNKRITVEELMRGAPDGTAAAPSIAFESDPNTGIYSPGADQLAISTGGTGRLFVDASGRLGLGTSSPSYPLHVNTAGASDIETAVQNSAGLSRYGTRASGNSFLGSFTAGKSVELWSADSQVGVIDSTGRLGIGTTGPSQKLHVSGEDTTNVGFNGTTKGVRFDFDGTQSTIYGVDNTFFASYQPLRIGGSITQFMYGGTEAARIDSSGRLLVGTSSDSGGALLQVNDNRIKIATANTPASASATGTTGEIAWDANYIYVCTATNTWKRTAISTW
jgi:hypothetical protein